jgi:hypothetical protein
MNALFSSSLTLIPANAVWPSTVARLSSFLNDNSCVLFFLTDEIEVISFANAAVIASVEDANLSDAEFNCVTTFFCEVYVVCNL